MSDRDWTLLINRSAAIREQFPTLAKVQRERPGSPRDRELREIYHEDNRRAWARGRKTFDQRLEDAVADADRFIEKQRQRELAEYAEKWHEKHGRAS